VQTRLYRSSGYLASLTAVCLCLSVLCQQGSTDQLSVLCKQSCTDQVTTWPVSRLSVSVCLCCANKAVPIKWLPGQSDSCLFLSVCVVPTRLYRSSGYLASLTAVCLCLCCANKAVPIEWLPGQSDSCLSLSVLCKQGCTDQVATWPV